MNAKKFILIMIPFNIIIIFILFIVSLYIANIIYTASDFRDKIYLLQNNPTIFFAGDSRAERQLNPLLASKILDINNSKTIVNIANSSADVSMVTDFIKQNREKFKNSTVIISVSSFEINDGATRPGYISYTSLSKLTPIEQIWINRKHPQNLIDFIKFCFKNWMKTNLNINSKDSYVNTLGYNPIDGIVKEHTITVNNQSDNAWYENWDAHGMRLKLFEASLVEIKKNVKNLYIYTGPFAPEWHYVMTQSKQYVYEKEFQHLANKICNQHSIKYINYFDSKNFNNDDFYDCAHLNKNGACKLTTLVIHDFIK